MKATVWKKQGIQGRPKSAGAQPQGREGTDSHGYWGHRVETVTEFYFLGLQNHCRRLTAVMKLKDAYSLEEKL